MMELLAASTVVGMLWVGSRPAGLNGRVARWCRAHLGWLDME